jgi:hypothetical protein
MKNSQPRFGILTTAGISRLLARRHITPYLIALGFAFAAIALSSATVLYNGKTPMIFFVLALILSAGRGFGPGLLASAVSISAVLSIFQGRISVAFATQSIVALFILIAIVVNLVFYELHRKNRELMKKNRALAHAKAVVETVNERLVDHAESLAEANATLAEERGSLLRAHEELRLLGHELANNIRVPLSIISETTEALAQSDSARIDCALAKTSMLIQTEVRRLGTLASQFAQVC